MTTATVSLPRHRKFDSKPIIGELYQTNGLAMQPRDDTGLYLYGELNIFRCTDETLILVLDYREDFEPGTKWRSEEERLGEKIVATFVMYINPVYGRTNETVKKATQPLLCWVRWWTDYERLQPRAPASD